MKIQVIATDGAYRVVAEEVPHFAEDGRQLYLTSELVAEGLPSQAEADRVGREFTRAVERRREALAALARVRPGEAGRLVLEEPVAVGGYVQQGNQVYRVIGNPARGEGHRVRPLPEVTPLEWSALQAEISAAGRYPSRHLTDLPPAAETAEEPEQE